MHGWRQFVGACFLVAISLPVGAAEPAAAAPAAEAPAVDFARDVRPILSANCFKCHGPDAAQRKADLRLDKPEGALTAVKGVAPFVAAQPDKSEALRRLLTDDADEKMPPPDSGKTVTPAQIATIRRWVEQGAKWSKHWAFVPPQHPAAPSVKKADWVANPIDAFVLARLEREGLAPAPAADKTTLLRRLSLDLVGLPPTPEEVDAFLADSSPDAYSKQVERLLASPHYGERWGRLWLDAARYADSDGYEKDKSRQVWFYRDWVVNALNRDLPYDQFIVEQLAGDELPNATQDQIVATGFLRNSMINEEGGVDPEQFRMEAMFDRMDAIGKGMLGLTIQCAQCHDHKYDPLAQQDYYRMFAYVNNTHEANTAVYTPSEQMLRADLVRQMHEIEAKLQERTPDWQSKMAAWEASVKSNQPEWTVLRLAVDDISTGGQKYLPLEDGSFLAQGYAPTKHTVKMTIESDQKNITAFQIELLTDPNLPLNGPGRSIYGTGALSEFEVQAAPAAEPTKFTKLKFASATADVNPPETELAKIFDDKSGKRRVTGPVAMALDGNELTAWGFDAGPGRRNQPRKAVFTLETPLANEGGSIIAIFLKQNHGGWNSDDNQNMNLGRMRLSLTSAPAPTADPVPARVRQVLAIAPESRSPAQKDAVFSYWRTTVPEWQSENDKIEALWKQHPEGSSQLVLASRDKKRETHILARGDFLKPGKEVEPGVPDFLNPLPAGAPPSRLSFARWITDRQSPTTARSIVNRLWQGYFGIGIVSTSEDLGSQSEPASHPELLDWLATELMDHGWSLKYIHRLIANSATYRQASSVTPDLASRDPYNRLLARGPRLRVDAELVHDIGLSASGLLNAKLGGPSVYPPAPEFLFSPPASYGPKIWKEETGEDRYRRALYTFRYRSVPYPALQAFDAPNGDFACVRRARSNTPMQALTTLNEPMWMECARALALKTVGVASDDAQRLTFAFRRCVARPPSDREREVLLSLLQKERERMEKSPQNALLLAMNKPNEPAALPAGVTPPQLAAWTAVSRVILNLDETITKE